VAKTTIDIAKGLTAKKPKPGAPYHLSAYRGDVVRIQKNPRPHKPSQAEAAWICAFGAAARFSKTPSPQQFNEASTWVDQSGWYYRDAIHAGMFGKLYRDEGGLRITTPTCYLYASTTLTLSTGVNTPVPLTNAKWDNNYFFDVTIQPTRMYFRSPGVYFVGAQGQFTAVSGQYRTLQFRRNGTETLTSVRVPVPTNSSAFPEIIDLIYADAGDYIELLAQTNQAGSNFNCNGFWSMAMTPEQVIPA